MSYFEDWMRKNKLSEATIHHYEDAITGSITQWACDNAITSGSLADVTSLTEFVLLTKQITALPIFIKRNTVGNNMYGCALLKYAEYLKDFASDGIEQDIDSIINSTTLKETEKASLIKTRIGQGTFRGKLINYWKRCSVSGFPEVNLLVASHIKPWVVSDNRERMDVFNGFLLLPNIDRAFDQGYITFYENGKILISKHLPEPELAGIRIGMSVVLADEHKKYLKYHRENKFRE